MRVFSLRIATVMFIGFLVLPSIAWGQPEEPSSLGRSPQIESFDKKALEKLRQMTPEEVDELDSKLAEALTLFYDREYARALPIFREISGVIETMDIMFWYATCAAKAGEAKLSIEKFRQILSIEPNLHRVRVELATVYYELGRYEEARRELQIVLEAKPPDPLKTNIEQLLASIEAKTKRLFTNLRASLAIQRDSNVSVGPDERLLEIPLGGGTIGPLPARELALYDWVVVANAIGNALYDLGQPRGWMWNTEGAFYQTHNLEYHEFDFTQWGVTTGPWWVGTRSVFKLPVGYADTIYEHDPLYFGYGVTPSYEYFFTPQFSLKGSFSYVRETFEFSTDPVEDRTDEDNINRMWELNPNFYFNKGNDLLSFYFSDENVNAKSPRWTYDAVNLAVAYLTHFNVSNWDMEFYTRFKYTKKEYAAAVPPWPADYLRKDKRYNVYVVLSRNFAKRYFASLYYNFIDNQSNTALYDYDKNVYGFSIGVKF
jgi:tetratricopeptide (TPR) repeat protein